MITPIEELTQDNQCNVCFIGQCQDCLEDTRCLCFKNNHGIDDELMACCYADPECVPDGNYEEMCDDHRGDYSADRADMRNDLD